MQGKYLFRSLLHTRTNALAGLGLLALGMIDYEGNGAFIG
jgi:hypothetical protein